MNHLTLRTKEAIRWVAVLPGAVISAFVAIFPIHWIVLINQYDAQDLDDYGKPSATFLALVPTEVLEQLARSFIIPFVVILAGTYIAPRYKLHAAIFLTALLCIFWAYTIMFVWQDIVAGFYNFGRWFRLGLSIALWFGGITLGLHKVRQHSKD